MIKCIIENAFAGLTFVATALRVELTEGEITLELLTKACSFFVKRHPLLLATIHRQYSEDKQFLYKHASHFVQMTDADPFAFKNVELIHTNDADKWRQVVELEMQTPLDLHNGPLWRLKVVKSSPCCYHFVWFVHHALTDGVNNVIFIELLNILGALIENVTCVEMSDEVIDSTLSLDDYIDNYFKSKPSQDTPLTNAYMDEINRRPTKLGNQLNPRETSFEYFTMPPETLRKLLVRMREKTNGVAKLTGLIEAVFCLSYKQVLAKNGEEELANLKPLQYMVQCGCRTKFGIGLTRMGCCNSSLSVHFNGEMPNGDGDNHDLSFVWSLAAEQSKSLHERLARDEDAKGAQMFAAWMRTNETIALDKLYHGTPTLSTSNVVVISSTGKLANARSSVLIATDVCVVIPTRLRNRFGVFMFMRVTSVNDKLCVSLSFNEHIYTRDFVVDLIRLMKTMLEQLTL